MITLRSQTVGQIETTKTTLSHYNKKIRAGEDQDRNVQNLFLKRSNRMIASVISLIAQ